LEGTVHPVEAAPVPNAGTRAITKRSLLGTTAAPTAVFQHGTKVVSPTSDNDIRPSWFDVIVPVGRPYWVQFKFTVERTELVAVEIVSTESGAAAVDNWLPPEPTARTTMFGEPAAATAYNAAIATSKL